MNILFLEPLHHLYTDSDPYPSLCCLTLHMTCSSTLKRWHQIPADFIQLLNEHRYLSPSCCGHTHGTKDMSFFNTIEITESILPDHREFWGFLVSLMLPHREWRFFNSTHNQAHCMINKEIASQQCYATGRDHCIPW